MLFKIAAESKEFAQRNISKIKKGEGKITAVACYQLISKAKQTKSNQTS